MVIDFLIDTATDVHEWLIDSTIEWIVADWLWVFHNNYCLIIWQSFWLTESHVTVQVDDCMGVLDFHPSLEVGVVYLSEADLVAGGDSYKSKLLKLAKVLDTCRIMDCSG